MPASRRFLWHMTKYYSNRPVSESDKAEASASRRLLAVQFPPSIPAVQANDVADCNPGARLLIHRTKRTACPERSQGRGGALMKFKSRDLFMD